MSALSSQRHALKLVGVAASTWHYRNNPRPPTVAPVPQEDRAYPSRLTQEEISAITEKIEVAFKEGKSVYTAWYEALDAGDPIASQRSWYRIAERHLEAQRPLRRRKTRRACSVPQFDATCSNQVWCWDITKLAGPYVGVNYEFYVTIDAFSRCIVGWRVEEDERDELAREMFENAFTSQGEVP